MKRLILVEGLPGTGKTTATAQLRDLLCAKGEPVVALFEGDDGIPCDFYEMAGIPAAEFDRFRALHPDAAEADWAICLRTENYVYLRLDRCRDFVAARFRKWDMGDERNRQVPVSHYIPCALERLDHWVEAQKASEETCIIDSGFLQNPINELLFRGASDEEVRAFILGMLERIALLHPLCVYLKRESAQIAMAFARQAKGEGWASRVDAMLEEWGCPTFFEHRFALELGLLPSIPHILCAINGDDWTDFTTKAELLAR